MASNPKQAKFTGKHMAAILVVGFGIVAAVNFYMASLAVGGFHGTVVDNSYVASQDFNTWLAEAEESRSLGWSAQASRDEDGFVTITTEAVPDGATLTAELRRPIGTREYASLRFVADGNGSYQSDIAVAEGRWTMRLFIEAGDQRWAEESELP